MDYLSNVFDQKFCFNTKNIKSLCLVDTFNVLQKSDILKILAAKRLSYVEFSVLDLIDIKSDMILNRLFNCNENIILLDGLHLRHQYTFCTKLFLQIYACITSIIRSDLLIILITEDKNCFPSLIQDLFDETIHTSIPKIDNRIIIWNDLLKRYDLDQYTDQISKLAQHSSGFVFKDCYSCIQKYFVEDKSIDLLEIVKNSKPMATNLIPGKNINILTPDDINVSLTDVIGHDKVKDLLWKYFYAAREHRKLYKVLDLNIPSGILMYGPPGTGKTLLATSLAKESHSNYVYFTSSDVVHGAIGESEKAVERIFILCRSISPTVVFIDEVQAIFGNRNAIDAESISAKLSSQLCLEFDRLQKHIFDSNRVLVIGATNLYNKIDKSLIQAGRFEIQLEVGLPTSHDRTSLLQKVCRNNDNVDYALIARLTEGFSIADLEGLVINARINYLESILADTESLFDGETYPKVVISTEMLKTLINDLNLSTLKG